MKSLLFASREAEIRAILDDARLTQQRHPGFSDALRPNHPSNLLFNQVEDLLAELDRTRAATADLLAGLVKLLAPARDSFAGHAIARIHAAAADMGLAL